MTATLERWWTPAGKIPVEQLLKSGSDAEKDLGIALLALHRAGAEACELVAKTAVADEHVLIAALAETRALMAPLAVEVVAKGVETPQYAGLLLKDLLDDAEVAALALYRTCLAKNLAPPIAAERVGMVYGVSSRAMGRYASVASDPKANPRAVQDLADRTLFGYVSKVVKDEYVPAKEPFSKAPVGPAERPGEFSGHKIQRDYQVPKGSPTPQTPYEDAHNVEHGPGGRYVREKTRTSGGVDLQALFDRAESEHLQQVGEKTESLSTGPPQVARRPVRMRRMQRASRPAQTGSLEAAPLQARSLSARELAAKDLSAAALEVQALAEGVVDVPWPLAGVERKPGDVLAPRVGPSGFKVLGKYVSLAMTQEEYLALARAGKDTTDGHVMRAGAVTDYAGKATPYVHGKQVSEGHRQLVGMVQDIARGKVGRDQEKPVVVPLPKPSTGYTKEAIAQAKLLFLEKAKETFGLTQNAAQMLSQVRHAPDLDNPEQMLLIWRPPAKDHRGFRRIAADPIPGVVEVIFSGDSVKGSVDPGNGKVELETNQPVVLPTLFDKPGVEPGYQQFYDKQNQTMVFRTVVTGGTEEEISKAQSEYLDAHNVVNGPSGRFVAETLNGLFARAEVEHAEPEKVEARKPVRMARMRRMQRATRPTQAESSAPLQARTLAVRPLDTKPLALTALQARALDKAHTNRPDHDPTDDIVDFDEAEAYLAVPNGTIEIVTSEAGHKGWVEDVDEPVQLSVYARSRLLQHRPTTGRVAEHDTEAYALGYWNAQRQRLSRQEGKLDRVIRTGTFSSNLELEQLALDLASDFERDESLSAIRVSFHRRTDGRMQVKVTGNAEALPVIHLAKYGQNTDPDRPVKMTPQGRLKRTHNAQTLHRRLLLHFYEPDDNNAPFVEIGNPRVKVWQVE